MKVEVLYFEGCPNSERTLEMVEQVVSDLGVDASVTAVEVKDPDQAHRARFFGSPTVQVNGTDADPAARSRPDYGDVCQMYGNAGTPPWSMIEAVIREQVGS